MKDKQWKLGFPGPVFVYNAKFTVWHTCDLQQNNSTFLRILHKHLGSNHLITLTQSFRRRKRHSFPASSSIWRRLYISRGSFPGDPATKVQKQSNSPIPGLKLPTKVKKFRPMPAYVPGVTPKGWPLKGEKLTVRLADWTVILHILKVHYVLPNVPR